MKGEERLWRIRVGDWRIGYEIDDSAREVTVIRVGHRSEFYDQAGEQRLRSFFITHSPQPHLDGGYTVFGQVVEGMDVVNRIARGDRIERVEIVEPK